jgi:diguanylate cyclase (GGDEF)-like protein
MLLPLGALELVLTARRVGTPAETPSVLPIASVFLPYLLLVAVVGLMLYAARFDLHDSLDAGVYIGGAGLLGLALVRQLVVVLENRRLIRKQMHTEEALRESEAALRHLALHDSLTGLPNRRLLMDRLDQMVALSPRRGDSFALMLIDLDHFKAVNDRHGHLCGDMLLKQVAKRLQTEVRASDTVARLAGDEFAVLLPDIEYDDAAKLAAVLAQSIQLPFSLEGPVVIAGGSVGVALFPLHAEDAESLLRYADDAMYLAKRTGVGALMYERDEPEESVG